MLSIYSGAVQERDFLCRCDRRAPFKPAPDVPELYAAVRHSASNKAQHKAGCRKCKRHQCHRAQAALRLCGKLRVDTQRRQHGVTHCRGKRIVPEPAERAHELAHERPIIHAADCDEHAQRRKRQPQDCPAPVRQLRYHTGDIYAADKAHGKRRRGNGGSGHHNAPCSKQDEKQYRSYRRKAEPDNDKRLACGLFLRLCPFRRTGRQAPSDRRALRRSPPRSSRRP